MTSSCTPSSFHFAPSVAKRWRHFVAVGQRAAKPAALFAGLLALITTAGVAQAAGQGMADAQAQAQYRQTVADCRAGRTQQSLADCLREAGAALQEARSGRLVSSDDATRQANALVRCQRQSPAQRSACEKLARGEGRSEGSVAEGGVLRTLVEIVPFAPAVPAAAASSP